MKIPIDINSYISNFLGGNARSYMFYVHINFPGVSNVLSSNARKEPTNQNSMIGLIPPNILRGEIGNKALIKKQGIELIINGAQQLLKKPQPPRKIDQTNYIGYYVKSSSLPSSSLQETTTFWCGQQYKMAGTHLFDEWTVSFNIDNRAELLTKFYEWHKIIHDPETNQYGSPALYMCNQEVHLLSIDSGSTICSYELIGAWPKNISQVQLDYSENSFATVDVTFAYQYHIVKGFENQPAQKPKGKTDSWREALDEQLGIIKNGGTINNAKNAAVERMRRINKSSITSILK